MRLGQRVGALELHGILRGENRERARQRMRGAVHGHLQFFHGFEQRGLRARRHAVDLIDQQQVGENRPAMDAERSGGRLENISAQDVGGNQVRRALHALELQAENMRERFDRQSLGQARHALDQRMAARQDHEQQLVERFVLPHDDLGEFPADVRCQIRYAHFHEGLSSAGFR